LPYFEEKDFIFERPKEKWHIEMAVTGDLLKGISACLLTSSKDSAQPALMGVCLNAPRHSLYSCDGDAVSRYIFKKSNRGAIVATLPNAFCETLLKIDVELPNNIEFLKVSNDWAMAVGETGYTVYGRVLQTDSPLDHEALIAETLKGKLAWVSVPDGLDYALSRARVLADPESAKTILRIESNKLLLITETKMGTVKDAIALKHKNVEAHVSANMVQRSLAFCDELCIFENCVAFRSGEAIFQLLSNMD
jgi:hypothetical protein